LKLTLELELKLNPKASVGILQFAKKQRQQTYGPV